MSQDYDNGIIIVLHWGLVIYTSNLVTRSFSIAFLECSNIISMGFLLYIVLSYNRSQFNTALIYLFKKLKGIDFSLLPRMFLPDDNISETRI